MLQNSVNEIPELIKVNAELDVAKEGKQLTFLNSIQHFYFQLLIHMTKSKIMIMEKS